MALLKLFSSVAVIATVVLLFSDDAPAADFAVYRKHASQQTQKQASTVQFASHRYRRVPGYLRSPNFYRYNRYYSPYSSYYRPRYSYRPWYLYPPRYFNYHYNFNYYSGLPNYWYGAQRYNYRPYFTAPFFSNPYGYRSSFPYIASEPRCNDPIIIEQNNYDGCYHW